MASARDNGQNSWKAMSLKPMASLQTEYGLLLKKGALFTKVHLMGARKKLRKIWLSDDLSKIFWGSAKDRKSGDIKGHQHVSSMKDVQVNKDSKTIIVVFSRRKLELQSDTIEKMMQWSAALTWLRRQDVGLKRQSMFKRYSLLHVDTPDDILDSYKLLMKLLKGVAVTRYKQGQILGSAYIWVSFLLDEIAIGSDIGALHDLKKPTTNILVNDMSVGSRIEGGDEMFAGGGGDSSEISRAASGSFLQMSATNPHLCFYISSQEDGLLAFSVLNKKICEDWVQGLRRIQSMSQMEKEAFYWYYCNQSDDKVICSKGKLERDNESIHRRTNSSKDGKDF